MVITHFWWSMGKRCSFMGQLIVSVILNKSTYKWTISSFYHRIVFINIYLCIYVNIHLFRLIGLADFILKISWIRTMQILQKNIKLMHFLYHFQQVFANFTRILWVLLTNNAFLTRSYKLNCKTYAKNVYFFQIGYIQYMLKILNRTRTKKFEVLFT